MPWCNPKSDCIKPFLKCKRKLFLQKSCQVQLFEPPVDQSQAGAPMYGNFIARINSMNKWEVGHITMNARLGFTHNLAQGEVGDITINNGFDSPEIRRMQSSPLILKGRDSVPSWDMNWDTFRNWDLPCYLLVSSNLRIEMILRMMMMIKMLTW